MLPLKAIFIQSATLTGNDAYFKSGFWKSQMVEMYKNSPSTKLLSLRKSCRNVFIASKIPPPPVSLSLFSLYLNLLSGFLSFSVSFPLYFSSSSSFPLPCPSAISSYNDQIKYYAQKISQETPRIFRSVLDVLPRPISTTLHSISSRKKKIEWRRNKMHKWKKRRKIFDISRIVSK